VAELADRRAEAERLVAEAGYAAEEARRKIKAAILLIRSEPDLKEANPQTILTLQAHARMMQPTEKLTDVFVQSVEEEARRERMRVQRELEREADLGYGPLGKDLV
jgi:hypothetical protein